MKGAALALGRRGRWAISFADLCLLLLGFFVLLQASAGHRQDVVDGVSRQFGGPVAQSDRLVAARLFQPGEAILTPAGIEAVRNIARRHRAGGERVELRSTGLDPATHRFDNWDLAAARVGAVARKLVEEGVARQSIVIRGLDQEQGGGQSGQMLTLTVRPASAGA